MRLILQFLTWHKHGFLKQQNEYSKFYIHIESTAKLQELLAAYKSSADQLNLTMNQKVYVFTGKTNL